MTKHVVFYIDKLSLMPWKFRSYILCFPEVIQSLFWPETIFHSSLINSWIYIYLYRMVLLRLKFMINEITLILILRIFHF